MTSLNTSDSIFVAGHRGLVGSAIIRSLQAKGFTNIITATRAELDLRDQSAVEQWFAHHQPKYVYLVAGTVGGILANSTRPAEFIYDNLMIHATVVHAAYKYQAKKLLYLGSSCIYPRQANQPMAESELLSGYLEPTNEPYAIAKIAGIKLCQAYRRQYGCNFVSAMPTNLYGPHDNFDLSSSHVIPALIRKFHEAALERRVEVTIWGTGNAKREFLYVDDLADACTFVMEHYESDEHINIGTGHDVSIADVAGTIRDLVYPSARLVFDTSMPDGTPRKLLDVSKLNALGWKPRMSVEEGLAKTYEWFCQQGSARGTA